MDTYVEQYQTTQGGVTPPTLTDVQGGKKEEFYIKGGSLSLYSTAPHGRESRSSCRPQLSTSTTPQRRLASVSAWCTVAESRPVSSLSCAGGGPSRPSYTRAFSTTSS